jgi:hypothetical protein
VCFDPAAAPVIGRLLRGAGAAHLVGAADHVEAVAATWGGEPRLRMPMLVMPADSMPPGGLDPRTRIARVEDVPAIVALYERFELEMLPHGRALAGAVEGLVRRLRVAVAVEDGEVLGVIRSEARTRRWDWWSGHSVPPEHRGRGLGRALENQAWALSSTAGRRGAAAVAPSNPMPRQGPLDAGTTWAEAAVPSAPEGAVDRARSRARRIRRRAARRWAAR